VKEGKKRKEKKERIEVQTKRQHPKTQTTSTMGESALVVKGELGILRVGTNHQILF
jgi:hypothetical protein